MLKPANGRRDERGATIVEAAFALPLLFFLVLGFLDLSNWEYQRSQATAAARDGARTGIIHYRTADDSSCSSGTDCALIHQAVGDKIARQSFTLDTPVCIHPNDTNALTHGCGGAIAGCDRIQVRVHWTRQPFSFVGGWFGTQTITGEAEMVIAGSPGSSAPSGVDPQGCV